MNEESPVGQPASPDAAAISTGAEAVGLPPTMPTAETAPPQPELGSRGNPTVVEGSSSQAGLASFRPSLGNPNISTTTTLPEGETNTSTVWPKADSESTPTSVDEVTQRATEVATDIVEGQNQKSSGGESEE